MVRSIFLLILLFLGLYEGVRGQVADVVYGKNREQFHDDMDQWFYYESDNVIAHWYGKSRKVGEMALKITETEYSKVIDILEHRTRRKIELFVFSDLTDMNQSNIGVDDVFMTTQNDVKVVGRKVFVYFEEDLEKLRTQIREGIARVIIADIYNPSLLQSSLSQEEDFGVPQWFYQGLGAYIGRRWSGQEDAVFKRYVRERNKLKFNRLARLDPRLAGHAFWYFMETRYNRKLISNIVYLTKIGEEWDDAILYLTGVQCKDLIQQWETYFEQFYLREFETFEEWSQDSTAREIFRTKNKITDIYALSGEEIIYVENKRGQKKVKLLEEPGMDRTKLFKKGYVNFLQKTDYNYPLVSVDEEGGMVGVIYEYRDQIILRLLDMNSGELYEEVLPERYERVNSFDFYNGDTIVMSAFREGVFDLILYKWSNRQGVNLTSDIFSERDVSVVHIGDKKGVLFTSDRSEERLRFNTSLKDIDRINSFDIFFIEIGRQPVLYRLKSTPYINERKPQIRGEHLYYLSNQNGISNLYRDRFEFEWKGEKSWLDSREKIYEVDPDSISNPLTLERIYTTKVLDWRLQESSALTQNLLPVESYTLDGENSFLSLVNQDKKYRIFRKEKSSVSSDEISTYVKQDIRLHELKPTERVIDMEELDSSFISTRWGNFQGMSELVSYLNAKDRRQEIPDINNIPFAQNRASSSDTQRGLPNAAAGFVADTLKSVQIPGSQITAYRTQFTNFGFNTELNNQPLFGGYDAYSSFDGAYSPQPISVMPRLTIKDLLENHVVEIGFRLPTTLDGTEIYVKYEDRRRKLDRYYAVYRKSQTRNEATTLTGLENVKSRSKTLLAQFGVKYPIDVFNSVRARATLRSDEVEFLVGDQRFLNDDFGQNGNRISLGLEYVFDNAMMILPNIQRGSKMKMYVDAFQQFELTFDESFSFGVGDQFMTVVGLDARHYVNFLNYSVLALRLAGETSFGTENVLYYLGGTDNWLNTSFDQSTAQPTDRNFAFARPAPNLRGFDTNVRNGSSHALFNSEVRVPVFTYLGLYHSRINFLRNFQVVGFFDMGTAWEGLNPFNDENPLNTVTITEGPVTVVARYDRDPLVYGYGVGARTTVFGYFLRVDYAWGIESGIIQEPRWFLSLGYDF